MDEVKHKLAFVFDHLETVNDATEDKPVPVQIKPTAWTTTSPLIAGTYAVLTGLEGQITTPSILGRSMRLSSVLVFLSIVFWGWMWGMIGVFLAVPILIALTMISQSVEAMSPVSALLGGGQPGGDATGKPGNGQ